MSNECCTLVSAEALAAALGREDLRVVDCRFSLAASAGTVDAGERAWRAGHVPGAVYAHLDRDLSGPHGPGRGRHPWPTAAAFAQVLGRWGIDAATQVVAYDDGDGAFAARLWWLLRSFGHRRVAVLDGGWARWTTLGLPVEAQTPVHLPREVADAFDTSVLLYTADDVQRHVATGGLLVDARAAPRFRGEVEPIDPRAGHVPGAINRPYMDNLLDGRFKPADALAREFDALLDGHPPSALVAMCGSGVTACHHLLAMAHAGLDGARLYTGSWSGWIDDPARPVATGP
jgi:thiosulfate/3-mercaptopyruvate sulfurtransferase